MKNYNILPIEKVSTTELQAAASYAGGRASTMVARQLQRDSLLSAERQILVDFLVKQGYKSVRVGYNGIKTVVPMKHDAELISKCHVFLLHLGFVGVYPLLKHEKPGLYFACSQTAKQADALLAYANGKRGRRPRFKHDATALQLYSQTLGLNFDETVYEVRQDREPVGFITFRTWEGVPTVEIELLNLEK